MFKIDLMVMIIELLRQDILKHLIYRHIETSYLLLNIILFMIIIITQYKVLKSYHINSKSNLKSQKVKSAVFLIMNSNHI